MNTSKYNGDDDYTNCLMRIGLTSLFCLHLYCSKYSDRGKQAMGYYCSDNDRFYYLLPFFRERDPATKEEFFPICNRCNKNLKAGKLEKHMRAYNNGAENYGVGSIRNRMISHTERNFIAKERQIMSTVQVIVPHESPQSGVEATVDAAKEPPHVALKGHCIHFKIPEPMEAVDLRRDRMRRWLGNRDVQKRIMLQFVGPNKKRDVITSLLGTESPISVDREHTIELLTLLQEVNSVYKDGYGDYSDDEITDMRRYLSGISSQIIGQSVDDYEETTVAMEKLATSNIADQVDSEGFDDVFLMRKDPVVSGEVPSARLKCLQALKDVLTASGDESSTPILLRRDRDPTNEFTGGGSRRILLGQFPHL
jgi:hypothetical protein